MIRATWPILLGMGLLMLGAGLQGTLIGLRATLEGFPASVIGIVMACYYVGFLGGTLLAPRLVQRVGHVRVFAAFTSLASVTILLQAMFVGEWVWGLMRLASGVCFAGIYVVAESWLNDRATSKDRGRLLAIYMLVMYLGLGVSQFLLNLSDPLQPMLFMLVSALISVALIPTALSVQKAPEFGVPGRVGYRELYRASPLGVVAVMVSGIVSGILFAFGPVYAQLIGLDQSGIATFMAASILAAACAQYPIGRLSDRMDRRTVIAWVCLLAFLVALAAALSGSTLAHTHLLLLAAVFGGLSLTLYSLALSHINDHLHPSQMVAASSSLILMNGYGAALGPLAVGILIQRFGPPAYFGTLAALCGALAIFDVWRKTRTAPVPAEHKGPFITAQPQAASGQIVAGVVAEANPQAMEDDRGQAMR